MNESVGQQLRQAREERSIVLEQIAAATHIRLRYLEAIEAGDFHALPSPAQARGFVRAYASYLKVDPQPFLDALGEQAPHLSVSPPSRPLPPPVPEKMDEGAEGIFTVIGQKLRSQRELLGLTMEDVERHTHLRIHFLKALESGDLTGLPSPVQGRGMLKNYAVFLGLDPEPLLMRYAEGLQARLASRRGDRSKSRTPVQRKPVKQINLFQRMFSLDFILTTLVVVFLGSFLVWGALRIADIRATSAGQTATPTSPSVADVLLPRLTPSAIFAPVATVETTGAPLAEETAVGAGALPAGDLTEEAPLPNPDSLLLTPTATGVSLPEASSAPIQVHIVVRQRAWMRVTVDGEVEFDGRVVAGSAYTFEASDQIDLVSGNGAALQVYYNQTDLGVLGMFGEVVDLVFTRDGILAPTPTVTPTRAPTETPTPGPTPSPTPEF